MHSLTRTTLLPGTMGDVFTFFSNHRNLERITPPWLGFRILSASGGPMRVGTRIRYALRLHGIPVSWESRIAEFAPGSHFADEQTRGPYAHWYHRHVFREVEGGVEMTDDVAYRLPLGPLGRLVHWLIVRHQLRAIFDYRTEAIGRLFAARGRATTFGPTDGTRVTPRSPREHSNPAAA